MRVFSRVRSWFGRQPARKAVRMFTVADQPGYVLAVDETIFMTDRGSPLAEIAPNQGAITRYDDGSGTIKRQTDLGEFILGGEGCTSWWRDRLLTEVNLEDFRILKCALGYVVLGRNLTHHA